MTRKEIVLSKLVEVPEKEWAAVAIKCRDHIRLRIKHKTLFGAHSTSNLGMPAEQYYFNNAVEKLYDPINGWDWKFETYTLEEQLIRIINSMISEEVRKVKTSKADALNIVYSEDETFIESFDDSLSIEEVVEGEERIQKFIDQISTAIQGDEDLEMLYLFIQDGKSYDEIAIELGFPDKNKLYKLVERLKDKVKKYLIFMKKSNDQKS